jgi:hypothetical protein
VHPHRPRAGTTLHDTEADIATALAKARPSIDGKGKTNNLKTKETSMTALIHDKQVAKTLLDKFCSLAQTRLLGIIAHGKNKIKEQASTNMIRNT